MRNQLGYAERAVYELIESGRFTAAHAALYRRPVAALANAGLVRRTEDGAYVPVHAVTHAQTIPSPPPESKPASEPSGTLVVRVPQRILDALDAIGPTRSEATRSVLNRALGSGLRKAVGR